MIKIPRRHKIHGHLITLRTPTPDDYPEQMAILNHRPTMEALIPFFKTDTWSLEMVSQRYQKFQEHQNQGTGLNYAVEENSSKSIIGTCGFKDIDFQKNSAEFGIILHQKAWGRRIAQECHLLCLEYGFIELSLSLIHFHTDHHNIRMRGFFNKMGIAQKTTTAEGFLRFELLLQQWPAVKKFLSANLP